MLIVTSLLNFRKVIFCIHVSMACMLLRRVPDATFPVRQGGCRKSVGGFRSTAHLPRVLAAMQALSLIVVCVCFAPWRLCNAVVTILAVVPDSRV